MKRSILRLFVVITCFAALTAAPVAKGQKPSRGTASIAPVRVFGGEAELQGSGSLLFRTAEGVYMTFNAFGLAPGEAVTAWWVFFNSPKECATSPCTVADLMNPAAEPSLVYATGRVAGTDGTANFGAFRAVGDTTGAFTGPGLLNAKKAEIHLVLRSHGPATDDPAVLMEQLTQFNGGCPEAGCANIQVSVHQP